MLSPVAPVGSDPADGAVLETAPGAVTLTFATPPDPGRSHISAVGPAGTPVAPAEVIAVGRSGLRLPVSIHDRGDYTVAYHAVLTDGSEAAGVLRFSVGTGVPPAASPAAAAHGHGIDPFSAALLVVDLAVLIAVVLLLRRPRPRVPQPARSPGRRPLNTFESRREGGTDVSETAILIPGAGDAAVVRPVVEFVRAVNDGDLDTAVAQLAPGAVHHARACDYTPDRVRMVFTMLRQVFPDLRLEIRKQEVQGNRVVSHVTATGSHLGSYLGRPPTGETVVWQSVDVAEVGPDHGRVSGRHWDLWNDPELFRTLGFVPAMRS